MPDAIIPAYLTTALEDCAITHHAPDHGDPLSGCIVIRPPAGREIPAGIIRALMHAEDMLIALQEVSAGARQVLACPGHALVPAEAIAGVRDVVMRVEGR